jgi:hypothetical protein
MPVGDIAMTELLLCMLPYLASTGSTSDSFVNGGIALEAAQFARAMLNEFNA